MPPMTRSQFNSNEENLENSKNSGRIALSDLSNKKIKRNISFYAHNNVVEPSINLKTFDNNLMFQQTSIKMPLAPMKKMPMPNVDFIEVDESGDISMYEEYNKEAFQHMMELENMLLPSSIYMEEIQEELSWELRKVVIDWKLKVHERLKLLPETLFLSVNLFDRYLSNTKVAKNQVQLISICCIFIASKYEEIHPPQLKDIHELISNNFKLEQILEYEILILSELKFDLGYPSPYSFFRRINRADQFDCEIRNLCKYLVEVCLHFKDFIPFTSSKLAATSYLLVLKLLDSNLKWSNAHIYYSNYFEEELQDCLQLLVLALKNINEEYFVYQKYSKSTYSHASKIISKLIQNL